MTINADNDGLPLLSIYLCPFQVLDTGELNQSKLLFLDIYTEIYEGKVIHIFRWL